MLKSTPQTNTIGAALSRSARKNATSIALKFQDRQWTYKALDLAVNKIANQFLKQGLQPGDRVVAYGKNSDAYGFSMAGYFACWTRACADKLCVKC